MSSARRKHQFQWNQWLAATAASSAMFGSSLDIVWYSEMKYILSEEQRLVTKASASVFVIIGAIIGAIIADIFGRRRTLLVSSILVIPRMADPYLTPEFFMWINRILISLSSGITCVVVPLYISEIADANNRGNLMVSQLSVHSFGHLATWIVDAIVSSYDDWQTAEFTDNTLIAISTLFHVITLWVYPETPHYLNWKKRYKKAIKSLAFFKGVEYLRLRQDLRNLSRNSHLRNEGQRWYERMCEIVRFKNHKNLAIIFFLIVIRRASGQERNLDILMDMENELFPILGFGAATSIASVFVMLRIDVFGLKPSLLLMIFGSFITAVISTTTLIEYPWILAGVLTIQQFCYFTFIAVTLAYAGTLFSTSFRTVAIALVISCEVVTRIIFFTIDELFMRSAVWTTEYTSSRSTLNCVALFVAFFFLLFIPFPKTKRIPYSEIAMMETIESF